MDLAVKSNLEEEISEKRNSLTVDGLQMSYGELLTMYEREELVIDPEFQRLFRWTNYQQTRFLESIILGIPTPPIFVTEDGIGKWEVVDGLQRLSTIFLFLEYLEQRIWLKRIGLFLKAI